MKHFDTEYFSEIITGMTKACNGIELQQIIAAATQIYLADGAELESVKVGQWKVEQATQKSYVCRKVVECTLCGTRRGVFMGDTIDYCCGCGARMEQK